MFAGGYKYLFPWGNKYSGEPILIYTGTEHALGKHNDDKKIK